MKSTFNLRILIVLFVFLISSSLNAAVINYYVSTGGNNSNNGRSQSAPFRTINYAISKCTTATDDYIINLMPNSQWGAFRENVRIRKTSSIKFNSLLLTGPSIEYGSDGMLELETARIGGVETNSNFGNPVISIEASNVEIQNLRVFHPSRINTTSTGSNLISIAAGCSDIHIYRCFIGPQARENAIYNNQGHKINGMNVSWEFDVDDDNDIPDFYPGGKHGIFINGSDRNTNNITIEECVIYYITGEGEGIMMYAPKTNTKTNSSISNVYIINNYIMMCRRSGILAAGQISNSVIEGNTIYHNGWYPIDFDVANTSNIPASEYGNGIVIMKCFEQGENSTRESIDLTGNSVFDNYNTGIYVFGGTRNLYITYNTDIWGNKDGLVFNGDPADPTHPYNHNTGSQDYNFSNINISDLLIHSNQRFGIYYNAPDNTNPIVAENTYFEEPTEEYGWGGPEESLGPKMAWGEFNKEADTYYEQNAARDGGRDFVNENSWYYDPADENNYMTLPSIVYGPVDANPYCKSLLNKSSQNFKVNANQTDRYFDNINNVSNCFPAGNVEDTIYVYPSSTPYTNNNLNFDKPIHIIGVDDESGNKPVLKYTTNNGTYVPAIVSTSTANIKVQNLKLVCRNQNGDLIGKIANSSATGNITLIKTDFFKENQSLNNLGWSQLSAYFEDNADHNDGRGRFSLASLMPSDTTRCVLWLAGDSFSDMSEGDTVTSWPDKSTFENQVVQNSSNYRPRYKTDIANYHPGISTISNQYLNFNPPNNYSLEANTSKSIFIVFKTPNSMPCSHQIIFEVGNLNCGYSVGLFNSSCSLRLAFTLWNDRNSATFLESSPLQANTIYFVRMWFDNSRSGTNFRAYINGNQIGDGRNFSGFVFNGDYDFSCIAACRDSKIKTLARSGLSSYFTGQIAEILVYNNYSESQWNSTVSYFCDKYNFDQNWPRTSLTEGEQISEENYDGTGEHVSVFPNPFINEANINVAVPETQNIRIEVFDALGRVLTTLFDGVMNGKTYYDFNLSANDLQSGVYFVKVTGLNFVRTEKIILNK